MFLMNPAISILSPRKTDITGAAVPSLDECPGNISFYKVPLETVFSSLKIQAAPGDEKITLQDLAEKYNKSPAEVGRP